LDKCQRLYYQSGVFNSAISHGEMCILGKQYSLYPVNKTQVGTVVDGMNCQLKYCNWIVDSNTERGGNTGRSPTDRRTQESHTTYSITYTLAAYTTCRYVDIYIQVLLYK